MLCFVIDYELSYMTLRCQVICHICIRHLRKIAQSDYCLRHVHLSDRMEQLAFPLDGFPLNFIVDYFSIICRENSSIVTTCKNNGYST